MVVGIASETETELLDLLSSAFLERHKLEQKLEACNRYLANSDRKIVSLVMAFNAWREKHELAPLENDKDLFDAIKRARPAKEGT